MVLYISPMPVECYAQRLLNPYRGTMHVIKYEAAEAVTLDGVHLGHLCVQRRAAAGPGSEPLDPPESPHGHVVVLLY